jgi:hypothetical protein
MARALQRNDTGMCRAPGGLISTGQSIRARSMTAKCGYA